MSNLIQYIIQEDPEEERRRQEERDKGSILMSNKSSENKPEQAYKYSPNNLLENDFSSKSTEPKPTNLLLAGLKDKQDPNGTTPTKSSSSGLGLGSANQPSTPTQLAETNPPSHHNKIHLLITTTPIFRVILSMIISIVTSIILDMVQGLVKSS